MAQSDSKTQFLLTPPVAPFELIKSSLKFLRFFFLLFPAAVRKFQKRRRVRLAERDKLSYFTPPNFMAADLEHSQTFKIILPNLIHKSKKRNLK